MTNTARTLDIDAIRQIAREAVGSYAVAVDQHGEDPSHRPELNGILRCLAIVTGGNYHAGYDREASAAWRDHYNNVVDAVAAASRVVNWRDSQSIYAAVLRICAILGIDA